MAQVQRIEPDNLWQKRRNAMVTKACLHSQKWGQIWFYIFVLKVNNSLEFNFHKRAKGLLWRNGEKQLIHPTAWENYDDELKKVIRNRGVF